MKKIALLAFGLLAVNITEAKKVKFAVDMNGLTINSTGVHVMGDFQAAAGFGANWQPNTIIMSPGTGTDTDIYSVVVDVPAFTAYQYQFINGDQAYPLDLDAVPIESAVNSQVEHRWLYVDSLANDTTFVGAIVFSGNAPVGKKLVRFKVNTANQSSINAAGIHVAGSFQGSDPATTRMYSFGNDVYEHIAYVNNGTYTYRFYNGNTTSAGEIVSGSCATSNNRNVAATFDVVLDPVCYGTCTVCYPTSVSAVNNQTEIQMMPNPASQSVKLALSNNGAELVTIQDVSGRIISRFPSVKSSSLSINTANFNRGLYIVRVQTDASNSKSLKLILQ
jgi:alpha-amylase